MLEPQRNHKDDEKKISILKDVFVLGLGAVLPFYIIDIIKKGEFTATKIVVGVIAIVLFFAIIALFLLGLWTKKFPFMKLKDKEERKVRIWQLSLNFLFGILIETASFASLEIMEISKKVEVNEVGFSQLAPELFNFFIVAFIILGIIRVLWWKRKYIEHRILKIPKLDHP